MFLLEYLVEAVGQAGAILDSCRFLVPRRTFRPLTPPLLASTLHRPVAKASGAGFRDAGTVEVAVAKPTALPPGDTFPPDQLRARFRLVPIDARDHYGFAAEPAGAVASAPGLPDAARAGILYGPKNDRKPLPEVRFGESPHASPLPWDETFELPPPAGKAWETFEVSQPDAAAGTKTTGFRVTWTVEQLRAAIESATDAPIPRGQAVEVWVGREASRASNPAVQATPAPAPNERSALTPSRHAILFPPAEPPVASVASEYLGVGNPVRFLEFLPEVPAATDASRFLMTDRLADQVDYGVWSGQAPPDDVTLRVELRMPPEPPESAFEPVIGFRVHRADRLDPTRHRPGPAGIEAQARARDPGRARACVSVHAGDDPRAGDRRPRVARRPPRLSRRLDGDGDADAVVGPRPRHNAGGQIPL